MSGAPRGRVGDCPPEFSRYKWLADRGHEQSGYRTDVERIRMAMSWNRTPGGGHGMFAAPAPFRTSC